MGSRSSMPREFENRLVLLEEAQRETHKLLEQLLVTMLSDSRIPHAIEGLQEDVRTALSRHSAELSAANAAQWAAVERLILAVMSNRDHSYASANDHHTRPPLVSGVDKVT